MARPDFFGTRAMVTCDAVAADAWRDRLLRGNVGRDERRGDGHIARPSKALGG